MCSIDQTQNANIHLTAARGSEYSIQCIVSVAVSICIFFTIYLGVEMDTLAKYVTSFIESLEKNR